MKVKTQREWLAEIPVIDIPEENMPIMIFDCDGCYREETLNDNYEKRFTDMVQENTGLKAKCHACHRNVSIMAEIGDYQNGRELRRMWCFFASHSNGVKKCWAGRLPFQCKTNAEEEFLRGFLKKMQVTFDALEVLAK